METTLTETFIDSAPLLADPAALRHRADEAGYLCLRGLLPRDEVLALREDLLEILDGQGFVSHEAPLMAGLGDREAIAAVPKELKGYCGVGVPQPCYLAIQQLESFHRLPHHPRIYQLYQALLGGTILPHPRHIARMMLPGPANTPTPPHQDFVHIQGTPNVWTLWFPLGDCPVSLGGLSILAGSHRDGLLPVYHTAGAGGVASWLCRQNHPWVQGDLEAGDVLTFHSHTVHKSLPNLANTHIRLSLDCRYQRADEPINERSLLPHCQIAPWEHLYRGWQRDDLKYYWRQHDLQMAGFDESLNRHQEKVC